MGTRPLPTHPPSYLPACLPAHPPTHPLSRQPAHSPTHTHTHTSHPWNNHLLQEQSGERLLVRAALGLAVLQAACTYMIWSAALQQAEKERRE